MNDQQQQTVNAATTSPVLSDERHIITVATPSTTSKLLLPLNDNSQSYIPPPRAESEDSGCTYYKPNSICKDSFSYIASCTSHYSSGATVKSTDSGEVANTWNLVTKHKHNMSQRSSEALFGEQFYHLEIRSSVQASQDGFFIGCLGREKSTSSPPPPQFTPILNETPSVTIQDHLSGLRKASKDGVKSILWSLVFTIDARTDYHPQYEGAVLMPRSKAFDPTRTQNKWAMLLVADLDEVVDGSHSSLSYRPGLPPSITNINQTPPRTPRTPRTPNPRMTPLTSFRRMLHRVPRERSEIGSEITKNAGSYHCASFVTLEPDSAIELLGSDFELLTGVSEGWVAPFLDVFVTDTADELEFARRCWPSLALDSLIDATIVRSKNGSSNNEDPLNLLVNHGSHWAYFVCRNKIQIAFLRVERKEGGGYCIRVLQDCERDLSKWGHFRYFVAQHQKILDWGYRRNAELFTQHGPADTAI